MDFSNLDLSYCVNGKSFQSHHARAERRHLLNLDLWSFFIEFPFYEVFNKEHFQRWGSLGMGFLRTSKNSWQFLKIPWKFWELIGIFGRFFGISEDSEDFSGFFQSSLEFLQH